MKNSELFPAIFGVTVLLLILFIYLNNRGRDQRNLYRAIVRNDYFKIISYLTRIKNEKIYGENEADLWRHLKNAFKVKCASISKIKSLHDFVLTDSSIGHFLQGKIFERLGEAIRLYDGSYFAKDYLNSLIQRTEAEEGVRAFLLRSYDNYSFSDIEEEAILFSFVNSVNAEWKDFFKNRKLTPDELKAYPMLGTKKIKGLGADYYIIVKYWPEKES